MASHGRRRTGKSGNNTGVLFEAVFTNGNKASGSPLNKSGHGIVLSYAGNVYTCNQDTESARSVHTILTDDEEECEKRIEPRKRGKIVRESSSLGHLESAHLKKLPGQPPKKLRRSRTLSPSQPPKRRSLLAPFANISRKLSRRRHSYDQGADAKQREKKPIRQEESREQLQKASTAFPQCPAGYAVPRAPFFPHQHQFPMYRYVPVNLPQPAFAPFPTPVAYPVSTPGTAPAPQLPPELQHLQHEINRVTVALAANPIDGYLRGELNRLILERNTFLDSATKQNIFGPAAPDPPHAAAVRNTTERTNLEFQDTFNAPSHEGICTSVNKERSSAAEESDSPDTNHICSGCGAVRSASFHKKHEFTKPVHNVCRKCRDGKRFVEVMERYHFCQSCGIVRSKEYQRRHASSSSASRSKICRKCHAERNHSANRTTSRHLTRARADIRPQKSIRAEGSRDTIIVEGCGPSLANSKQRSKARDTEGPSPTYCDDPQLDGAEDYDTVESAPGLSLVTEESALADAFSSHHSDEDLDSYGSKSAEGIPYVCDPDSRSNSQKAPQAPSPTVSDPVPGWDSSDDSVHELKTNAVPNNPYYRPRKSTDTFQFSSSVKTARVDLAHSAEGSPRGSQSPESHERVATSRNTGSVNGKIFLDRNKSWPGDLHLPSSEVFSGFPGTARKVSASDGFKTPEPSPTTLPEGAFQDDAAGRFSKGVFGKVASSYKPSTPTSPWAAFSGPIPNPAPDSGSRGVFSDTKPRSQTGRASSRFDTWDESGSTFGSNYASDGSASPTDSRSFPFRYAQPKSFSSRQPDSHPDFGSTRGAWNINTSSNRSAKSGFSRRTHDAVPEPIIEEPSSTPPQSPATTPLLLDSSTSPSSDGSLASDLDALDLGPVSHH